MYKYTLQQIEMSWYIITCMFLRWFDNRFFLLLHVACAGLEMFLSGGKKQTTPRNEEGNEEKNNNEKVAVCWCGECGMCELLFTFFESCWRGRGGVLGSSLHNPPTIPLPVCVWTYVFFKNESRLPQQKRSICNPVGTNTKDYQLQHSCGTCRCMQQTDYA